MKVLYPRPGELITAVGKVLQSADQNSFCIYWFLII